MLSTLCKTTKAPEGMPPALHFATGHQSANAVGSLTACGLEGLDLEAQLLAQGAGDEAANAVRLPAGCAHQVLQGCAAGAFQQGHNLGLFGVLSACVRVLLSSGLPCGLAPRRRDVAAVFAG